MPANPPTLDALREARDTLNKLHEEMHAAGWLTAVFRISDAIDSVDDAIQLLEAKP